MKVGQWPIAGLNLKALTCINELWGRLRHWGPPGLVPVPAAASVGDPRKCLALALSGRIGKNLHSDRIFGHIGTLFPSGSDVIA